MKLIVLAAYDRDDEGELFPAFEPREARSAEQAVRQARELSQKHAGVIVWEREAQPDIGEYGPPEVLFQAGEVPDME